MKGKEAEDQRKICEADEKVTEAQRFEATTLKVSCENDLAKVLPILENASKALDKIKQEDITTIKSFVTPPRMHPYFFLTQPLWTC